MYPDWNYTGPEVQNHHANVGDVIMPTCYNPFSVEVDLNLRCMDEYNSRHTSQVVTLDNITVTKEMDGRVCRCEVDNQPTKTIIVQTIVKFDVYCKYLTFF